MPKSSGNQEVHLLLLVLVFQSTAFAFLNFIYFEMEMLRAEWRLAAIGKHYGPVLGINQNNKPLLYVLSP